MSDIGEGLGTKGTSSTSLGGGPQLTRLVVVACPTTPVMCARGVHRARALEADRRCSTARARIADAETARLRDRVGSLSA
ncbi:hypothetical protein AURDEDRAFT_166565 [Auricularia subglabra TFB-10046 SS5]|nr:hypothetical protein AURDEDRAFT_166565 [Auricularia subglabra TFB-10046 SS5]